MKIKEPHPATAQRPSNSLGIRHGRRIFRWKPNDRPAEPLRAPGPVVGQGRASTVRCNPSIRAVVAAIEDPLRPTESSLVRQCCGGERRFASTAATQKPTKDPSFVASLLFCFRFPRDAAGRVSFHAFRFARASVGDERFTTAGDGRRLQRFRRGTPAAHLPPDDASADAANTTQTLFPPSLLFARTSVLVPSRDLDRRTINPMQIDRRTLSADCANRLSAPRRIDRRRSPRGAPFRAASVKVDFWTIQAPVGLVFFVCSVSVRRVGVGR